ncbi:uncharacterized protein LOC144103974 isoform X3 [Amblyomma americanum]
MTGMCLRAAILFLLVACATASVWRTNFIIDRLLPTIGLKKVPLHDISFDVDHAKGTFSGFVEFHLQKGTLGNLQQRMTGMCLRATIVLLLVASVTASVWRTNFIIDRLLPTIGLKEVPLPDISFDVDHAKGTFSGFVEFHLQKGTLGNFHQRVRRSGGCKFFDNRYYRVPRYTTNCDYSLRGLVAKYDVEVIVDRKSKWMETQVLVSDGKIHTRMASHLGDCTKCTKVFYFRVEYMRAKLMPLSVPMDLPADVMKNFEHEVVSRVSVEIAYGLNTTYKEAVVRKMASLKGEDLTS